MNRSTRIYAVLALLVAFAFSTGCKGKGGSAPAGTVKGTFVKTVAGDSSGAWGDFIQTSGSPNFKAQLVYSGASGTTELYGSGYITAISLRAGNAVAAGVTCPNITVKMGHTGLAALTTFFASNVNVSRGSLKTVLLNRQLAVPALSAGDRFRVDLDTPFLYNGVDGLVVEYTRTGYCSGDLGLSVDMTSSFGRSLFSTDLSALTGTLERSVNMRFHFSGGDDTVEFGGSAPATAPFSGTPTRTQLLYTSGEINGSGPIRGLGFEVDQLTTEQTYSYTVTMGHTTLAALDPTFAANVTTGAPAVVATGVFTVPVNIPAGNYIWIPLTGTFTYNGKDNLLVDIDVSAGSGDTVLRHGVGTVSRRVSGASGTALGTNDDWVYHTRFRFQGGTMDVLTPNGIFGADTFPLAENVGKRQYLYRATELGTGGTIAGIACRNANGPADEINAMDDMNLTVVVSHTTATMLGSDFASNMPAPVTVRSGPFTTAPTAWGDWIDFPFTIPFSYSGKDNLVVQFDWAGFQPVNPPACAMDTSAARYPSRRVASTVQSAATGTVDDRLMDLRFILQ